MRTFLDAQRLLSCRGDFDETELAYILPDDQHTLLIRMKRPDGHLSWGVPRQGHQWPRI